MTLYIKIAMNDLYSDTLY